MFRSPTVLVAGKGLRGRPSAPSSAPLVTRRRSRKTTAGDMSRSGSTGLAGTSRSSRYFSCYPDAGDAESVGFQPMRRDEPPGRFQGGPDRRRRPSPVEQQAGGAGASNRDVVDAVAAGEHRPETVNWRSEAAATASPGPCVHRPPSAPRGHAARPGTSLVPPSLILRGLMVSINPARDRHGPGVKPPRRASSRRGLPSIPTSSPAGRAGEGSTHRCIPTANRSTLRVHALSESRVSRVVLVKQALSP